MAGPADGVERRLCVQVFKLSFERDVERSYRASITLVASPVPSTLPVWRGGCRIYVAR